MVNTIDQRLARLETVVLVDGQNVPYGGEKQCIDARIRGGRSVISGQPRSALTQPGFSRYSEAELASALDELIADGWLAENSNANTDETVIRIPDTLPPQ